MIKYLLVGFLLLIILLTQAPIAAEPSRAQATTWQCLSGIPAPSPSQCQPQALIYLNNGPAPVYPAAPLVTPITYPTEIPPLPGPTAIPSGLFRFRLLTPAVVYTCPNPACIWGWTIQAGTELWLQMTNIIQEGERWYWIKSGDFAGEFLWDNGSFQRLQ